MTISCNHFRQQRCAAKRPCFQSALIQGRLLDNVQVGFTFKGIVYALIGGLSCQSAAEDKGVIRGADNSPQVHPLAQLRCGACKAVCWLSHCIDHGVQWSTVMSCLGTNFIAAANCMLIACACRTSRNDQPDRNSFWQQYASCVYNQHADAECLCICSDWKCWCRGPSFWWGTTSSGTLS